MNIIYFKGYYLEIILKHLILYAAASLYNDFFKISLLFLIQLQDISLKNHSLQLLWNIQ